MQSQFSKTPLLELQKSNLAEKFPRRKTMANIFNRIFKGGSPVTSTDLGEVKTLNTKGIGGQINTLGDWKKFFTGFQTGDEKKLDAWTLMAISILKNWQTQKFIYENLPAELPVGEIERLLFFFGKCIIFSTPDGYRVSTFEVKTFDFYYRPKIVKPILALPKASKFTEQYLEVGKNCVLITNDYNFLFNKVPVFGTLWKIWDLLDTTRTAFLNLKRNLIVSRQWIKVSPLMSTENIQKVVKMLERDSLILPLDNTFSTNLRTRGAPNELSFSFDDKTEMCWENYYNLWDLLKNAVGIKSNSNTKKKERQITDEIAVNNEISTSQLESMFMARKEGFDEFNRVFSENVEVKINEKNENEPTEKGENEGNE